MSSDLPVHGRPTRLERPEWLKVRLNTTGEYEEVRRMMRRLSLVTVCEEARCPNIHECWARERTATFMLLGDICTRHCGFCAVGKGTPGSLDPDEPGRVAEAARELSLAHAVVTSVNRDDLPDGGAAHFAATIRAIRSRNPGCTVEVLIPDFQGNWSALETVLDEAPEILNHNLETVSRLYRRVRPDAKYGQSLELLARAHERRARTGAALKTKSGVMVGLGETREELLEALRDLRAAGCDIATIGQYLQPHERRLPIERYYTPEEFADLRAQGEAMGFFRVEAGPLVRSSYHARRAFDGPAAWTRMPFLRTVRGALAAFLLVAGAAGARAQTQEAVRTRYQPPVYPEKLAKALKQGNVLLAGRIDTRGRVSDLHLVAASAQDFIQPAAEAVQGWQFRPATRDGKPVEVFLNVGVRFRMEGETRGKLDAPILGDVAISPADASGRKSAPEGFPIRRGRDPALRAEALLDLPPSAESRTIAIKVEAVSPKGKRVPVFQPPVAVPPNATEVRFPVVAPIGPDWEEGVWMLRFLVNGAGVGGGQFWLAADPTKFSFVIPTSPQ